MIEYPSVDELMAGPLGQWLNHQTAVREQAKSKARIRLAVAAVVLVPVLYLLITMAPFDTMFKVITSIILVGFGFVWSKGPEREATKRVKTGINEALAHSLGLSYHHDCEATSAFKWAEAYELVPHSSRSSFEDLWVGDFGDYGFHVQEAHLEDRRGSGNNRRWVTVFRGPIMAVDFEQEFHAITLVVRKGSHSSLFRKSRDSVHLNGQVLDIADMVNPEFTDTFDVYTTDQTEARWLIHPEYVERLIEVERAFGGDDIVALFAAGDLVLTLNSGNLFESGSINAKDDRTRLARTISQLQGLSDLAFTLNRINRRR